VHGKNAIIIAIKLLYCSDRRQLLATIGCFTMQEQKALSLHSSACNRVAKVKGTNYTTPAPYLSRQNEC